MSFRNMRVAARVRLAGKGCWRLDGEVIPMAAANATTTALERGFERKVRLSGWALTFEALWPRLWAAVGLAGLFIAVSLAGLWPRLPTLAHQVTLAAFGLVLAGVLLVSSAGRAND